MGRQKPKPKGNRPTHRVWVWSEAQKGTVGAAWLQADGTLHLKLNPFTVLNATMTIKVYPVDPDEPPSGPIEVSEPEPVELERAEIPY